MSQQENSRIWTSLYREGLQAEQTTEFDNTLSAFQFHLSKTPAAAALYFFEQSISYLELDQSSDALAVWLQDENVQAGDRVSIICQNIPAFPMMMLAAWKIGAVPVPGNPLYLSNELGRILKDAEPAAILCEAASEAELKLALPLADLEGLPLISCTSDTDGKQAASTAAHAVESILKKYQGKKPNYAAIDPDSLGLILYTSGTTGVPKGAMISHRSLSFTGQFVRDWFALKPESRMYAVAPFFHITGFVSHLCAALVAGCSNVFNYRFSPDVALNSIKKWQPTHTVGAITVFNALISLPGVKKEDLASLKEVYSGGAPNPPALKEQLEQQGGFKIHPVYGMTESSGPAIFTPFGKDAPEIDGQLSIGVPVPSTDIKIVGDDGKVLPTGEAGEVLIKGPQLMQGYWRKPEDTASTLVDGWLHSGDVGFMDERGWVYLVDRKKDVIIASGFKVWPREVEDVLYTHPDIREAAVVGIEDAYRGENVKACISLREGASLSEEDIISHCRARLTGYKVPRVVDIMDELPKTTTGKIQRVALRENA